MRITLIHYTAPPVVGGVERVMAGQATLLASNGHTVSILAGLGEPFHPAVRLKRIPLLDSQHPRILACKQALDCGVVSSDFAEIEQDIFEQLLLELNGQDALILHNVASLHKNLPLTSALNRCHQHFPNLGCILWHHDLAWISPGYQAELHPGYPWDLLRKHWPGVRQVVVSELRRQELASLDGIDPTSIQVIPSGLDVPAFLGLEGRTGEMYTSLHLSKSSPILLAPVRITRRKNLEQALMIIAALQHQFPDASLVVTGPPGAHNPGNRDYLTELQDLRASLNLTSSVHFLAEHIPAGLTDGEVAGWFRVADALLLCSREEGFGIPILEAALTRLPIFCTNLPSLRSLAGKSAHFFAPDDDPGMVAGMIAGHLEADPLFRRRADVLSRFSWQAIYEQQLLPLLKEVIWPHASRDRDRVFP